MHVFSASFRSELEAIEFCQYQCSDREDPMNCGLSRALDGQRINCDFVEAVFGEGRFDYLATLLQDPDDVAVITTRSTDRNALILVMEIEENKKLRVSGNCGELNYCGRFKGCFR